ncbi:MAG: hypothetical protein V7701_05755 [Sneathiella sp.]
MFYPIYINFAHVLGYGSVAITMGCGPPANVPLGNKQVFRNDGNIAVHAQGWTEDE